jgi:Skp family chaperone for outer membrane proteins
MKKVSKLMTVVCSAVMLIGAANNFAMSSPNNFTYAVVDVPQVVAASKQVNALKAEQATKLRELSQFVQTANKQLQAEPDATKKKALEQKLNKQLQDKKAAVDKNYAAKLEAIDKSISGAIAKEAKAKGLDIVLAKGVVLYGTAGTDITADIIKAVK